MALSMYSSLTGIEEELNPSSPSVFQKSDLSPTGRKIKANLSLPGTNINDFYEEKTGIKRYTGSNGYLQGVPDPASGSTNPGGSNNDLDKYHAGRNNSADIQPDKPTDINKQFDTFMNENKMYHVGNAMLQGLSYLNNMGQGFSPPPLPEITQPVLEGRDFLSEENEFNRSMGNQTASVYKMLRENNAIDQMPGVGANLYDAQRRYSQGLHAEKQEQKNRNIAVLNHFNTYRDQAMNQYSQNAYQAGADFAQQKQAHQNQILGNLSAIGKSYLDTKNSALFGKMASEAYVNNMKLYGALSTHADAITWGMKQDGISSMEDVSMEQINGWVKRKELEDRKEQAKKEAERITKN